MSRPRSVLRRLPALPLVVLLAACGGSDSTAPDPDPDPDPVVSVTVSPTTATVGAAGELSLTATVTGSQDTGVTWSATDGTVAGTGSTVTWTAPISGGTQTVTATSTADPTKSADATVTVTSVAVSLDIEEVELFRGGTEELTATVTGTEETGLDWAATCGTVEGSEASVVYTAPLEAGPCEVTATSTLDESASASALVTVAPDWIVTALDDVDDGTCDPDHCSLREALLRTNAGEGAGAVARPATGPAAGPNLEGAAVIRLPEPDAPGTLTLTSPLPAVVGSVEILGPGPDLLTVDADAGPGGDRRVLLFDQGVPARVEGLTLTGGRAPQGGGVSVTGASEVTLVDVVITGNEAFGGGGGGLSVTDGSDVRVENGVLSANRTVNALVAGAGFSVAGARLTLVGGEVEGNEATEAWGGGGRALDAILSLENVTVRDNVAAGSSGGGGGVFAEGESEVTLDGVTIAGNQTAFEGGGVRLVGVTGGAVIRSSVIRENQAPAGGGLVAGGVPSLSVTDTEILDNTTEARAAGVFLWADTRATLDGVLVEGNRSRSGGGGGIYLQNTVELGLEETVVRGNSTTGADADGAGIWAGAGTVLTVEGGAIGSNGAAGWGGGIFAFGNEVELVAVDVIENTASGAGAGITVLDGTRFTVTGGEIGANEALGGGGGIFTRNVDGLLSGVVVRDNVAAQGGGLQMLGANVYTLTDATLSGNEGGQVGGGISVFDTGEVIIQGTTISGNAADLGGGISTAQEATVTGETVRLVDNVARDEGGGAAVFPVSVLSLTGATVTGNTAVDFGAGLGSGGSLTVISSVVAGNVVEGVAGGIGAVGEAAAVVENSTVSGNEAAEGGGIVALGLVTLRSVSVVGNTSTDDGGGILVGTDGSMTTENVLLAGNTDGGVPQNCAVQGVGTLESAAVSLSDDVTCVFYFDDPDDLNGVDAGVDPALSDNGGPTATHALLAGSAAIDTGYDAGCTPGDQRGFLRAGPCDLGAFEFGGQAPGAAASVASSARPRVSPPPVSARRAEDGAGAASRPDRARSVGTLPASVGGGG